MNTLSLLLLPLLIGGPSLAIKIEPKPSTAFNGYYDSLNGYGNEFLGSLRDIIVSTHNTYVNYNASGPDGMQYKIDYDAKNKDNLIDFYTHASFPKTWDGGTTYQREHVWCVSLSNGLWPRENPGYGGADLHHIRPAFSSVNIARSNSPFGDLSKVPGDEGTGTFEYAGVTYPYGKEYNDTYFEPIDEVKGDVARIVMYLFVHYNTPENLAKNSPTGADAPIGTIGLKNDIDAGDLAITNVINTPNITNTPRTSFDLLLKWNKLDPVDDLEAQRNEAVYKIQGNRNPFIDYPEFADKIWGESTTPITKLSVKNTTLSFPYGQDLNSEDLRAFAHYEDGSYKYISDVVEVKNFDKFKLGEQTITISYKGTSLDVKITITNKGSNPDGGFKQNKYSTGDFTEKLWTDNHQSKAVNGVNWNLEAHHEGQFKTNRDKTKGICFGSSTNPMRKIVISSQDFTNKDISKVEVEASGANGVKASLRVLIDEELLSPIQWISNTSNVYTFEGLQKGSNLSIQYDQVTTSKALYLRSIAVYTNSDKIVLYSNLDQAKSYAELFLKETKDFANENLTFEQVKPLIDNGTWNKLKLEFDYMQNEAKDYFAGSDDATIKDAYTRYTNIVNIFKENNIDNDFVGQRDEPPLEPEKPETSTDSSEQKPNEPVPNAFDNKIVIIVVVVIAVIAITIICVLVLKHKNKSK